MEIGVNLSMKSIIKKLFNRAQEEENVIEFFCHPNLEGIIPEPRPSTKHIPDWFKKVPVEIPEIRDSFGTPTFTVKKCLPVLDAMCAGYMIPIQADVHVVSNHDLTILKATCSDEIKSVEYHDIRQLGGNTSPTYPSPPLKFINHWVIKTKPGWSCLFIPPVSTFTSDFTCMAGLVDTDRYVKEVNFPAAWNTPNFDGLIRAGTPMVQVIPFKRGCADSVAHIRKMTDEEFNNISREDKIQRSRHHRYTKELRDTKR